MTLATTPKSRRTFVLSLAFWAVLGTLLQVGLGIVSLRRSDISAIWVWFAGTPAAYLLIGLVVAFSGTGGLSSAQTRSRAARLTAIGSLLGTVLTALVIEVYTVIWLFMQRNPSSPPPSITFAITSLGFLFFILLIILGPLFLATNTLGIMFASLGGQIGGAVRAWLLPVKKATESTPSEQTPSGSMAMEITIMTLAAVAAVVIGVLALLLATGTIPATN